MSLGASMLKYEQLSSHQNFVIPPPGSRFWEETVGQRDGGGVMGRRRARIPPAQLLPGQPGRGFSSRQCTGGLVGPASYGHAPVPGG